MACGKPVITTGLGGAQEIVTLGEMALTVDAKNPEEVAVALTKLVSGPALRQQGSNGLSTAHLHFGRERLARERLRRMK